MEIEYDLNFATDAQQDDLGLPRIWQRVVPPHHAAFTMRIANREEKSACSSLWPLLPFADVDSTLWSDD